MKLAQIVGCHAEVEQTLPFVVLGVLQGVVSNDTELLALRFLLGFAIGAEYAIGQAMLAEFVPSANRGALLSTLQAAWYGGFLLAVIVAYTLDGLGVDWPWILATGAVPADAASPAIDAAPSPPDAK